MAEMELGYWKIRGLAAAIRMMLYYKQQTFKEVAYSSEDADAEWFGKDKPELKKKNSMINLPYLIDDDEVITQSNSILLYLGLKLGIDLPEHMIDNHQVLDQCMDLTDAYVKIIYTGKQLAEGGFKAMVEKHMETAAVHFTKLEGFLKGPYMCGAAMQCADFRVFELIDVHVQMCAETGVAIPKFAKLMGFHAKIKNDPALAAYFASDHYAKYAVNGMSSNYYGKGFGAGPEGPTVRHTVVPLPPVAKEKKEPKEQQAKETPEEKAAKEAAKAKDKLLKTVIKEGGKKGVEIEGAAEMGGLDFFCTTIESPEGDQELLLTAMQAMNADPDPLAEERKGCSGFVGKMIFSAGTAQLAIVAYVPKPESNKSSEKVDVTAWIKHVAEAVGGTVTNEKMAAPDTFVNEGKPFPCPHGGYLAEAVVVSNPEAGKYAIKDKDTAMAAAFAYLRSHGAFPEDTGDDDDEMVFGDDDDLSAYE
jgi:glutathione S-transferase